MSDDADDVDADGADENFGDSDGVFFSLARRTGSRKTTRDRGATARGQRGHRQRQVHQATPSPWVPRECPLACLVVVQALGVSHRHRLRRLGFAVPLLLHKDRLSKVQGVQEVAGTQLAPVTWLSRPHA